LGNSHGNFQLVYTGSPQVKISQIGLGGYFFDSHCMWSTALNLSQSVTSQHCEWQASRFDDVIFNVLL